MNTRFKAWDGKEWSKPFTLLDLEGDQNGEVYVPNVMSYPLLYLSDIKDLIVLSEEK